MLTEGWDEFEAAYHIDHAYLAATAAVLFYIFLVSTLAVGGVRSLRRSFFRHSVSSIELTAMKAAWLKG